MTKSELEQLRVLLTKLGTSLKKAGAPGSVLLRAIDALEAIRWMENKKTVKS